MNSYFYWNYSDLTANSLKSVLFLLFFNIFIIDFDGYFSLELTRVNQDRKILSINVELTSTFLPYRGLVHHYQFVTLIPIFAPCMNHNGENLRKLSQNFFETLKVYDIGLQRYRYYSTVCGKNSVPLLRLKTIAKVLIY